MTKQEKNEVIDLLKGKFSQYNNFYVTDTESLTVEQVSNLRRHCFDKQVEIKVAKNTLIKKALESLDAEKYAGVFDALHQVTALMFSENPKDPALILAGFRKANNNERPVLKAAFINGDVFVGDNQLKALTMIKTKNELIGEVIGLLQSPIQRVIGALQNRENATGAATEEAAAPAVEVTTEAAPVTEAPVAEAPVVETPVAEAPAAEAAPEAPAAEATDEAPAAE
jgi:large subunit ribosomal protein L10